MIGGTSWVSTVEYYKIINQQINERLGGLNAARLILYSMNYEDRGDTEIKTLDTTLIHVTAAVNFAPDD